MIDEYVSVERAERDYGVVITVGDPELDEYEVDEAATLAARAEIAANRDGWLEEDAHVVADRYQKGEIDMLDVIRRYGVILDWGNGELFEETTRQHRESMTRRSAQHWS